MTPKVQIVAPVPVSFDPGADLSVWNNWSGRLDSNQRPLPPERTAPTRTPRFSVVSHRAKALSNAPCSRPVHGQRFAANLRALSLRGAA